MPGSRDMFSAAKWGGIVSGIETSSDNSKTA